MWLRFLYHVRTGGARRVHDLVARYQQEWFGGGAELGQRPSEGCAHAPRSGMRIVSALVATALLALSSGCDSAPPVSVVSSTVQRLVVDTDLDLSDVAALAAVLREPKVDVVAVTLAPNGTGPWDCNTLLRLGHWVLERMSRADVPLACGREHAAPGALAFPANYHAGAARVWGLTLPPVPPGADTTTAAALISRSAKASPVPILVVALGPWTNLKDAFAADPKLVSRVSAVHAMAGAVDVDGNVQTGSVRYKDRLEWNAVLDPEAFRAVFAMPVTLRLVPLDATQDVPVPGDLRRRLQAKQAAPGAALVADLLDGWPERTTGAGQQLWDELAALAVTRAEVVRWEARTLTVAANTRLDVKDSGRPVTVAVEGHADATLTALVDALSRP
jgi:inosine-uridine nucleoside N-ribohydrolase